MRTMMLMLLFSALVGAIGCQDTTDHRSRSNGQRPKARLESINSVPRETLAPKGPGIERTPGGIATKLIYRGNGKRRATNQDALVLYSQTYNDTGRVAARGSELIGDPAVDLTKDGQEAIRMMFEGDVRRFWFTNPKIPGGIEVTDYEAVWISPDKEP